MSDLFQFIQAKIMEAERTLAARLDMQRAWSEGTDESWRAVGCTDSKDQRMKKAETHGRIALRNKAELESFQHIAELESRHAKALACLKLIADENAPGRYNGIKTAGDWCAEQARRTLEECG